MSAFPTNNFDSISRGRKIQSALIGTSTSVLYTVPSGKRCTVIGINLANEHTAATTVSLYHVRPTETASTKSALYYGMTIATASVTQDDAPKYLAAGDQLIASCSTGSHVCITVYGIEE